eukprot:g1658.t1
MSINEAFATQVEAVTQIENLLPEPPRIRGSYGDWMIWMVHRAWLNDPSLVDFNFGNMRLGPNRTHKHGAFLHMPPGHIEPRIAPKLVNAMARNTHIEILTLSNSNLQKAQGCELGTSLRQNTTVKSVNLESNWLDSNAFFGRPTEEAVGQMMWSNESIVKLGFECDDATGRPSAEWD